MSLDLVAIQVNTLESMEFPEQVIELAIEPKTKAGQGKLGEALAKLAEEDPTFRAHTDQETGQTIIAGMGELHLEIIVDRLLREFKVEANADNGLREVHGLQNDGVLLVAQRVTGGGILQTDSSRNIARVNGVDVLTVVGVHLQDTADTLVVILDRVVDGGACVQRTGVHTEEAELTDIRVSHDLEGQSCERLVVGGDTILLLAGLGVGALDGCNVGRSRHVVNNGIQQLLNAAVLVGVP